MSTSYEILRQRAKASGHPLQTSFESHMLTGTQAYPRRPDGRGDEDLDFDLRAVLHAIVRRRLWIFVCTAIMTAIAALVCFLMTPQYEAESTLEILKQNTGPLPVGGDATSTANSDPLDFSMGVQTQLAVLNSDTLAWQVIRELKLLRPEDLPGGPALAATPNTDALKNFTPNRHASELLRQFKQRLRVSSVSGTRLIEVGYLDSNPKRAADIVNQLVSDFVEYNFRVRYDATNQATEWLGTQLVELKSQVEQAQSRAVELQRESGIFGEDEHHNIVLTRLEQLNNELTTAEADRVLKENVYRLARSGDPEVVANLLGSQSGGSSGASAATLLNSLRQQEATIAAQYADAAAKYGPAYPRLIQLKDQLNSVRTLLAAEIAKVTQRAKSDYELSLARETSARTTFNRQKTIAAEMNDKATTYLIAKQEADSSRRLYQHLSEEVKEAGVLAGLHSSDLHVVDRAMVPLRPAKPKVPLYLAAGVFAGMLLGLICVFVVEATDRTVRNVGELEDNSFAPVLGVIPQSRYLHLAETTSQLAPIAGASRNALRQKVFRGLHDPVVAEAFRSVRTSLLLSQPESPAQVMLVTSGLQQEGKTFTSFHLAAALAKKSGRVLLIDGDLRRGTLSRTLNKGSDIGLSQVLLGSATLESVCHPVESVPGLSFLAAGSADYPRLPASGVPWTAGDHPSPPTPDDVAAAELLESSRMNDVLQACRERLAHIVIDTPPVLMVTDAAVLAPKVDAVLVVVRFAVTNRDAIARTLRVLQGVRATRIEILVNGVDFRSPEYYGYSGTRAYGEYFRGGGSRNGELITVPSSPADAAKGE